MRSPVRRNLLHVKCCVRPYFLRLCPGTRSRGEVGFGTLRNVSCCAWYENVFIHTGERVQIAVKYINSITGIHNRAFVSGQALLHFSPTWLYEVGRKVLFRLIGDQRHEGQGIPTQALESASPLWELSESGRQGNPVWRHS